MHQLAFPRLSKLEYGRLTHKKRLEDQDLQAVTDIVCDGIRDGLYGEIVPSGKRAEIMKFIRHLATRCEIRQYKSSKKCFRKRVAALRVYTVKGVVVGFGILAQGISQAVENGVDLLMLGVAQVQRGLGYGASILDSIMKVISHHGFSLIVRCPAESPLFFAMLITRGFVAVSRYAQGRVLRYLSLAGRSASLQHSPSSRYVE